MALWGQVVLPDKVHQDSDEIIFLEETHAAEDDTSAQQRGAVAALARVARDLPLERVLPVEFRPLFTSISEEANLLPTSPVPFPSGRSCLHPLHDKQRPCGLEGATKTVKCCPYGIRPDCWFSSCCH